MVTVNRSSKIDMDAISPSQTVALT
jgi:hypothetical protein